MQGLLADVNVQGHATFLRQVLGRPDINLWEVLRQAGLRFATLRSVRLSNDIDDRSLWNFCQDERWVLFTENRNLRGPDSLGATLEDSWRDGHLPVLTLSNKSRFEENPEYIDRVARDIAELLFGIQQGEYCDQPRIYVPLSGQRDLDPVVGG
jgi:hypothetical protein